MALFEKYNEQVQFIVVDVQTPQSIELVRSFKVGPIPDMYFLDAEGNTYHILGYTTSENIEANIKKIL